MSRVNRFLITRFCLYFQQYDLNKSGQVGVFGVQPHAKNTLATHY